MQNIEFRVLTISFCLFGTFWKKQNLNTKKPEDLDICVPKKSSAEMAWIFNPETFGSGFFVVSRRYSRAMSWWIDFLGSFTKNSLHHKGGTCNLSLPILKNGWSRRGSHWSIAHHQIKVNLTLKIFLQQTYNVSESPKSLLKSFWLNKSFSMDFYQDQRLFAW